MNRNRFRRPFVLFILSIILMVTTSSAASASQQSDSPHVPKSLQGPWYIGTSCSSTFQYEYFGQNWAVYIDRIKVSGEQRVFFNTQILMRDITQTIGKRGFIEKASYQKLIKGKDQTYKSIPGQYEFRETNTTTLKGHFVSPPGVPKRFDDSLRRCDDANDRPKLFDLVSLYMNDITNALNIINSIYDGCSFSTKTCESSIFSTIDINNDDKISRAELVTFLRKISILSLFYGKIISKDNSMFSQINPDEILGVQFLSSVVSPYIINEVIDNVDYNGDKYIEPKELFLFLQSFGLPLSKGLSMQLLRGTRNEVLELERAFDGAKHAVDAFSMISR